MYFRVKLHKLHHSGMLTNAVSTAFNLKEDPMQFYMKFHLNSAAINLMQSITKYCARC